MSPKVRPHPLEVFMSPRSVVVIGASRKTGPGSFNVIENMRAFGYEGKVYAVNPLAEEILGMKCYRDVKDLGETPELAIVSTPRQEIPRVVEDCASLGIRGAIIVPQGFADADEKGKRLQEHLTRISRDRGIRILGPNTLGVVDAFSGFSSSFMPLKREKSPVAVISQSGIFFVGAAVFTGTMGKGIDVGNGCDIDFADALEYFGQDEETRVIFVHIEGMREGRRFFDVARTVARKKPVIVLKSARSRRGAEAASSHSGSLVGKHEVFEAAFRQAGVISASDAHEVQDFTRAFLHLPPMRGDRVGLVTFTGAGGIILIDALQEEGLAVNALSRSTLQAIKDLSPAWMPISNPMDIWPALMKHGLSEVYAIALERLLQDDSVDGVICIAIAPKLPEMAYLDALEVIRTKAASCQGRPVVAWLYGPDQQGASARIEEGNHLLSLPTLQRAARTLGALRRRARFLEETRSPGPKFRFTKRVKQLLDRPLKTGAKKIDGKTARDLLLGCGIPTAAPASCRDLKEALRAAQAVGYPVALKIVSDRIVHKSDVGGVVLNIQDPEELERSVRKMADEVCMRVPGAKPEGFLVEKMAPAGFDAFLGAKRDPQFGPVLLFGAGGIYTEVWKDISYGIAPLGPEDARDMIRGRRCYEILKGVRGEPPYDVGLLEDALLRLSWLMMKNDCIQEIDINPFRVYAEGGLALDARFIF